MILAADAPTARGLLEAALAALVVAAAMEVGAYFVPALDHGLDTIATPLAVVAGIVVSAATFTGMPGYLRWILAVVGGGGAAGLVQGATALLRLKSGLFTGGLANPLLAALELVGVAGLALLAILVPVLALSPAVLLAAAAFRTARRVVFGRRAAAGT